METLSLGKLISAEKTEFPGITKEQVLGLKEIFGYFERIEYAAIYGSRVVGGYGNDSDLDVVLSVSNPKKFNLSDISDTICTLTLERLGLEVHLKVLDEIKNPDLLHTIEKDGVTIYKKRV